MAHPAIDLETHIADVASVLEVEDLADVVLLAHSYGGMVATALADRLAPRIRHIVYLDAFVPRHGQSLADLVGPEQHANVRANVAAGDGWRVPPPPAPPDTSPEDRAWIAGRRLPQPLKTFEQPVLLRNGDPSLPRTYIRAMRNTHGPFAQFAERARSESGWTSLEIDASHSPHITAPEPLMALLASVIV